MEDDARPREDNADGEYRSRNRIRKYRNDFQNALALRFDFVDNVRDHNAEEHTQYAGGNGKKQRIANRIRYHFIAEQYIRIIFKRKVCKRKRQSVRFQKSDEKNHDERYEHDDDE